LADHPYTDQHLTKPVEYKSAYLATLMLTQLFHSKLTLRPILLPSIGNIIFVAIFFVLIFGSGNGLLGDGDTGYHIRTGQIILKDWRIPSHDSYSFHAPALSWTAHEWLAEVIMALLFAWAGLTGVVVFFAFLLAFTHWLLYHSLRAKSDDLILCTFVALLATATSSTHWLARPHVFSILLSVIWCHCLYRYQSDNRTVYVGCLPFLMLLWVNLHGGFIIGLVLVGIYFVNEWFSSLTTKPDMSCICRERAKTLLLVLLACVAICLFNPYGFDILLFPIRVTSDRFIMDRVIEFLSPNFHEPIPFKYMLLLLIGALAVSRSTVSLGDTILTILLSYMALYSARHVSLFAVILASVLLKALIDIVARLSEPFSTWYRTRNRNLLAIDHNLKAYLWPILSFVTVVILAATGLISYRFDDKKFPVRAVEFLKRETIPGNMFNDDEFGDYMIYAAWPKYRVFMDGRSDMYGEKFGRDYLRIANVAPGWKQTLKKYDIRWIIFNTDSALTAAVKDQPDWQSIYSDPVATIFVKNEPKSFKLLAKDSSPSEASK
jgi:hypothetical protein